MREVPELEFNPVKCLVLFFLFFLNESQLTNDCDHQIKQTKSQPITAGLNQSGGLWVCPSGQRELIKITDFLKQNKHGHAGKERCGKDGGRERENQCCC